LVAFCGDIVYNQYMVAPKPNANDPSGSDTVVISFRAPRELVSQLDDIAKGDQRSRANFIVRTLTNAVTLEPAISVIKELQPRLVELAGKDPDGLRTEYRRGAMGGARSMLAAFFGKRAISWVNQRVREQTGLPMPTIIPLSDDGTRCGFDPEADVY